MEKAKLNILSYTKEACIAVLAIAGIAAYLVLKFVLCIPGEVDHIPLYIVLILGGIPLVAELLLKAVKGEFGSDLLAGISIVTAVLLGEYLAGVLVVLMLSGGLTLENFAVRRASSVLEALAKRMPNIAHLKEGDGVRDITVSEIKIGDVLSVFPHDICPVDGVVTEGHGAMDESYLTGEPFIISKTPGSDVISGAINGEVLLNIRATKLAIDSRYAKIMDVMHATEQKRPRLRRLGDQLGAIYTPVALVIAGLAWIFSGNPERFLAVLVIATPCPLLIAIPVAIIGSISLSARRGVIIKNPAILEQIEKCQTMILDKTGTLTYGKPLVTEQNYFNGFSKETALKFSASLERYSKHPLAGAILDAAQEAGLPFVEVIKISESPGQGLVGTIDHRTVTITSRDKLLQKNRGDIVSLLPQGTGLECVVLVDDQLAAHFRFHDHPRKEGRSFIGHLLPKHNFKDIMIVSGDREVEVRYLADQVGISKVYAGKSPEEKVDIVVEETQKAQTVYLGDGINDAPALAAATVGIAFGQHSDITSEAAGAVILESSLEKVDELMHIGRRMRTIALQSAVGGMLLSIIGMFFAAGGYLTPVWGAICQEIIDVFAVLNALRVSVPPKDLTDF